MLRGHIDKLNKADSFTGITEYPPGHRQWDFICEIPEARDSLIRNAEIGAESAFVYLTDACRRNCGFCNRHEKMVLPLATFARFVQEESAKKLQYIVLDGDSVCAENFAEYVRILNQYHVQYSVNAYTPIPAEQIAFLKDTVSKIQFRVEDHAALEKVIPSIDMCCEYGVYTGVIYSAEPDSDAQLKEAIALCAAHHVLQFSFSRMPFCPWDSRVHKQYSAAAFLAVSQTLIALNGTHNMHVTSNDANWKGCGAAMKTACVLADGTVLPCAYLKLPAGNIVSGSFGDAWSSPLFTELRRGIGSGKCGSCRYNILCKGCRALALEQTGDYMAEDSGCWVNSSC